MCLGSFCVLGPWSMVVVLSLLPCNFGKFLISKSSKLPVFHCSEANKFSRNRTSGTLLGLLPTAYLLTDKDTIQKYWLLKVLSVGWTAKHPPTLLQDHSLADWMPRERQHCQKYKEYKIVLLHVELDNANADGT